MGELRQHHPSLKVSQVKELPKGDLLIIGDSMQDMLILQNETKIIAALGKNVSISLPKAYQINKSQNKCLAVKGVPTNISEAEFLDFLNLNKISYAKGELLESKKDGRVLPILKLEIKDPAETEALISQNLYIRWKNFVGPFRLRSASTAKVSVTRQKPVGQNRNV